MHGDSGGHGQCLLRGDLQMQVQGDSCGDSQMDKQGDLQSDSRRDSRLDMECNMRNDSHRDSEGVLQRDSLGKTGTVPQSAGTRGTVPVFPGDSQSDCERDLRGTLAANFTASCEATFTTPLQ